MLTYSGSRYNVWGRGAIYTTEFRKPGLKKKWQGFYLIGQFEIKNFCPKTCSRKIMIPSSSLHFK